MFFCIYFLHIYFLGCVDISDQMCPIEQTEENIAVFVGTFLYDSYFKKFLNFDHNKSVSVSNSINSHWGRGWEILGDSYKRGSVNLFFT